LRSDPRSTSALGAVAQFEVRIESLGRKLPARRFTTKDWEAEGAGRLPADLERMTGIRERRICSEGEDSFTLAVDAAWDCLARSRHSPEDVEMLISCSISKYKAELSYHFEPPLSLSIKEAIGASAAISFDVSNACAGMMTGVTVLNDFIRRGVVKCGMVVSGEYISSIAANAKGRDGVPPADQLASLTVGDSGAAVVLERAEPGAGGIDACELVTYAEHVDLCVGKACPSAPGATMTTNARELHDTAIEAGTPAIRRALEVSGLTYDQIDHVIPHQTSARAIRAGLRHSRKQLGQSPRNVVINVQNLGNTGSTTHFLALYRGLREGTVVAGDRVLLVTYASGLVVGVIVLTIDDLATRMFGDQRLPKDGVEAAVWA
jgi:3-oxoacyl-[acyl-carrier-protein] synthase-3